MYVVATAGHVDHGKSTLVRALTGMEPDRWAEERRRGMTIDLGYAWTPVGDDLLAFVDVPGHERFIANMLAGLGPAPAVMFVVAADQGWQSQSAEHLAAVGALGVRDVLLVVTRSDLADPAAVLDVAREKLRAAGFGDVPAVPVSGATGAGLDDLRTALATLVGALPRPRTDGRVRLWVDRVFTVRGAGTVVTGTLDAGAVQVGAELELDGAVVRVRGLQSAGEPRERVEAVARVALNLRGVARSDLGRGDVLLTPGAWLPTSVVDVRLDEADDRWSGELMLHVGTAAVPVHVRPLGADVARLTLRRALPLVHGDRAVLREPGTRAITGVQVLDADPPPLQRRGAAARRAADLHAAPDAGAQVLRRGAVREQHLVQLGYNPGEAVDVRREAGWLIAAGTWTGWVQGVREAVAEHARADPLAAGMTPSAAAAGAGVPSASLVPALAADAGLVTRDGVLALPGATPTLGAAEDAVRTLEQRFADAPFRAPERQELVDLGLGSRQLTVAAKAGRLLRLPGDVVLPPDAAETAVAALSALPQPFALSDARLALGTTRRVAVPLMEHLDATGRTERVDGTLRRVR